MTSVFLAVELLKLIRKSLENRTQPILGFAVMLLGVLEPAFSNKKIPCLAQDL